MCKSSSSFKGHPLQVRHKQDWGRGFILLLPRSVALPESDAGSGVIKPASSFVIQNRQTSYSMCCSMCWNMVCGLLRGATLAIRCRSEIPFVHGQMELPNTSPQAVELNQAARGKPIPTGLAPSAAQKHGAWKHFHSIRRSICDLSIQKRRFQDWQGCPKDSAQLEQTGVGILASLGEHLRTHLRNYTRYDWNGPKRDNQLIFCKNI